MEVASHDGLGLGDFRVYFPGTQRAHRALGFRVWNSLEVFGLTLLHAARAARIEFRVWKF